MTKEQEIQYILEQSKERITNAIKYDWTGGFEPEYYHRWLEKELHLLAGEYITSTYKPEITI